MTSARDTGKNDPFYHLREIVDYEHVILDDKQAIRAEIDIPINGQAYGLGGLDQTTVYLIDRHVPTGECSVEKLGKFPIEAHALIVRESSTKNVTSLNQLQEPAWVTLFDNKEEALKEVEE
jgi:hypothetical protein